ncbi:MAG: hypothetical protein ACI35Q_04290 [Marinilabiliaceae bacterium]
MRAKEITASALLAKQNALHGQIDKVAKENGLTGRSLQPIYDGIYVPAADAADTSHIERYVGGLRVMWILKESYDGTDGEVNGGGWCIYHALDDTGAASIRTWQVMAYVTYGIRTGTGYNDMPTVDAKMIDLLKDVAYINVSKMPGRTQSNDSYMANAYRVWEETLKAQVETYAPDVVILGGTSAWVLDGLFASREPFAGHKDCYVSGGRLVIAAYHPNQKSVKHEVYVDGIASAARDFQRLMGIR